MASAKKIKVYVYDIKTSHSDNLSKSISIMEFIYNALQDKQKVEERRMFLNPQDPECDLMSFFETSPDKTFLFGQIMELLPEDGAKRIDPELLKRTQIRLNDLDNLNGAHGSICTNNYYFMISDSILLCTAKPNKINRLETYINWFIKKYREPYLFNFDPKFKSPDTISFEKIRKIEIGNELSFDKEDTLLTQVKNVATSAIRDLFKSNEPKLELQNIDLEQIIDAKLIIKIKNNSKNLPENKLKKIASAMLKPITDDASIRVFDSDGQSVTGEQLRVCEVISIGVTKNGYFNEEELRQSFEKILLAFTGATNV